jgi:hypothetical protein
MFAEIGRTRLRGRVEHGVTFCAAAALVVGYALPGGAFDVVVRGEFAVGLWWLVGVAALCGLLPRARPGRVWWPVGVGGLALVALTCVAFTSTASDELTAGELARLTHHLGILLVVALVLRRATFVSAVAGLAAGGVAICAVAVGSRLAPAVFPEDVVRSSFLITRLSYPLNYWNALGAWAAMSGVLTLALGAHLRHPWARAAAAAATPLCLVCGYLAYSRAAVVGTAAGLLVVLALSRHRGTAWVHVLGAAAGTALPVAVIRAHPAIADGTGGRGGGVVALAVLVGMAVAGAVALLTLRTEADARLRLSPRLARRAAIAGTLVVAVAAAVFGPGLASRAWDSFSEPATYRRGDPAQRLTNLNGNRRNIFASAIAAGRAEPLGGIGPGTFEFWWSTDARDKEFVRDAHSLYLEEFAELGVPGLLAIVVLVAGLFGGGLAAWRAIRSEGTAVEAGAVAASLAAFVVFAVQAGVDWMWESTACAVLGLGAGACALAVCGRDARPPPRRLTRGALVAGALAVIAVQLPPLVSLSRVRASQRAVARHDPEAARTAAADAIDAEPWAATPYVQRGLLEEETGDLRAATGDIRRAEALEPTNWRHPLLLARILAEQGDVDGTIAAYRRARRLRPLSERFAQP